MPINEVIDDSPAEEGGVINGDVILKIDDEKITDGEDLVETIHERDPGDKVEITYKRKRRTKTVVVKLEGIGTFTDIPSKAFRKGKGVWRRFGF